MHYCCMALYRYNRCLLRSWHFIMSQIKSRVHLKFPLFVLYRSISSNMATLCQSAPLQRHIHYSQRWLQEARPIVTTLVTSTPGKVRLFTFNNCSVTVARTFKCEKSAQKKNLFFLNHKSNVTEQSEFPFLFCYSDDG